MRSAFLAFTLLFFSTFARAQEMSSLDERTSGCCSWHGGVAGCGSNGRVVCSDGWTGSSCGCYYSPPRPPTSGSASGTGGGPSSGSGSSENSSGSASSSDREKQEISTLSGIYSGKILLRRFETTDPTEPVLVAGQSNAAIKVTVDHDGKLTLTMKDQLKDTYRGRKITKSSFVASKVYDAEPDCSLEITYRFTSITDTSAKVQYVSDKVCPSGIVRIGEYKGRVKRRKR